MPGDGLQPKWNAGPSELARESCAEVRVSPTLTRGNAVSVDRRLLVTLLRPGSIRRSVPCLLCRGHLANLRAGRRRTAVAPTVAEAAPIRHPGELSARRAGPAWWFHLSRGQPAVVGGHF